jgi:hypothetical protein
VETLGLVRGVLDEKGSVQRIGEYNFELTFRMARMACLHPNQTKKAECRGWPISASFLKRTIYVIRTSLDVDVLSQVPDLLISDERIIVCGVHDTGIVELCRSGLVDDPHHIRHSQQHSPQYPTFQTPPKPS